MSFINKPCKKVYVLMFLVGFLAVLGAWNVTAAYVYQETATAYYNDSVWTDGNITNAYDGNWATYASGAGNNKTLYINYTLPAGVLTSSIIQIQTGSIFSNRTIPAWCFNWSPTVIQFKVDSKKTGTFYQNEWRCYSNRPGYGGLEAIYTASSSNSAWQYIYEEGMYWDVLDSTYPIFFNKSDNTNTLTDTGVGKFNISINNTNGTVYLEINNTNITATNITPSLFNVSYSFTSGGSYNYKWYAYGNGSSTNLNISDIYTYTVLYTDTIKPIFTNYKDNSYSLSYTGTGLFNITITNTNGTVYLEINNTNISVANSTVNLFNASYYFTAPGTYYYRWFARGNGTDKIWNVSDVYSYYVQGNFTNTTTWCYQETANVSSLCGGVSSGKYNNITVLHVGGSCTAILMPVILVNYTKPANATNNTLYQVKMNNITSNVSIPSDCWNYNESKLIFRFVGDSSAGCTDYSAGTYLECYNGTWKGLLNYNLGYAPSGIQKSAYYDNFVDGNWNTFIKARVAGWNSTYEDYTQMNLYDEAMWWQLTQDALVIPPNVTTIDDCSAYATKFINFTIFNENLFSDKLVANLDVYMQYGQNNTFNKTFNASYTGSSSYALCFSSLEPNMTYSIYAQYTTNGFTHRYYITNQSYNGTYIIADVGNYNSSSYISRLDVNIKNPNTYQAVPNIYGTLQRFYVAEGVWRNVQWDKSGEFGLLTYNIREQDTDYRLVFKDSNNNVLKTTTSLKFSCQNYYCSVVYLLNPDYVAANLQDLRVSYYFDNSTGLLSLNWTDSKALTKSIRVVVTKISGTNMTIVCNNTQIGSSGSTFCDLSNYNGTFKLTVYNTASPEKITFTTIIEFIKDLKLWQFIGKREGMLYSFAIALTCVGAGLVSPVTVIITTLVALFIVIMMGLTTTFNLAILILAAIFGIILSMKMRV